MFIKKAMGCAQSKEAPARVLPPKPTVSLSSCVACDEDNAFPTPGAFASEDKGGDAFSLHAMRMADFLALERLLPHNELVAKGLVAALDFEGEHRGVSLNFISHQWLAYGEADPNGAHLSTMQSLFRRAIAGERIFRSEEDWNAYSKGYTKENAQSASTEHATASAKGSFGDERVLRSEAQFNASIADGWVWMDYISIPQTIGCKSEDETKRVLADQQRAIRAIPSYVQHATNFWICAPSGVRHVDAGHECNYETWHNRGWCRMEESVLYLVRLGDGRPLLVTQPFGEPARVMSFDKIDRAWNMTQRHSSVLTGAFSCCRLGHVVTSHDGKQTPIGCDKLQLKNVLHGLFDKQLAIVWKQLEQEGGADLPFEKRVGVSMKGGIQAFWNIWTFVTLKATILAETVEEPDFVELGWTRPFEELSRTDYETFCRGGNGLQGGYDSEPESNLPMMAWNSAMMGHLPMLRYTCATSSPRSHDLRLDRTCLPLLLTRRAPLRRIETLGAEPAFKNAFGMSCLLMTARFGHERCLRYLCERLPLEEIDFVSAGLGLSAICDAAKCGHPKCIATLIEFGAFVDPRRKNGKTPLHEAAAAGYVECARVLCTAGADVDAADNDGKTPSDLAAAAMPVRHEVLEVLDAPRAPRASD